MELSADDPAVALEANRAEAAAWRSPVIMRQRELSLRAEMGESPPPRLVSRSVPPDLGAGVHPAAYHLERADY